uniref:Glucuronate isomerase n=1 Tax=Grammatophora oceanica TaxID=210454 RepID=A0A7S1Y6Y3_9STRA
MKDMIKSSSSSPTVAIVFAYASLLRWLTPKTITASGIKDTSKNIFCGWLDTATDGGDDNNEPTTTTYADGLQYNLSEGWYTFKCNCFLLDDGKATNLATALASIVSTDDNNDVIVAARQPSAYVSVVRQYLVCPNGGNLGEVVESNSSSSSRRSLDELACAISTVLARMIAGDSITGLLQEYSTLWTQPMNILMDTTPSASSSSSAPLHFRPYCPIPSTSRLLLSNDDDDFKKTPTTTTIRTHEEMTAVVYSEVACAKITDVHTHLFPPSHGPTLSLWGIDELLTYHYLVAEYFTTSAPTMSPTDFYINLTKPQQADLIWKALFIDRLPVSEACRGVLTTLCKLGLYQAVRDRDLDAIRTFYRDSYQSRGTEGALEFSNRIFEQEAGVDHVVMTNIPFDATEAAQWQQHKAANDPHYKSALRVDPLLTGDVETVNASLRMGGYEPTLDGAKKYLHDWCELIQPEYMMASTPHDFVLKESDMPAAAAASSSLNPDALMEPGAFATAAAAATACPPGEEAMSSLVDENCDLLTQVLMPVCQERQLALALKIGAHRGINPNLKSAGDGLAVEVDLQILARLCRSYPKVKFLATVLSRTHQQEACVLASKFSNLHLYGCWWFCNTPSMIADITTMRIELLGPSAFTAQHSDARVLDQLIYKWSHSRAVVAKVLATEFGKLLDHGNDDDGSGCWQVTRAQVRRDVQRLLGGSYHEFMKKKLY